MDWQTFKQLCDQPDYWSVWMIDQCWELLQASDVPKALAGAQTLQMDRKKPCLPQPADHTGDSRTQMFQVTITQEQAQLLLGVIEHAACKRAFSQDTQSRGLGGFVPACEELIQWRAEERRG